MGAWPGGGQPAGQHGEVHTVGGRGPGRGLPEDGHWKLEVSDTGIGIPVDEVPELFQRFYRASNARIQAVPGSGLGLAIVRRVVELHGGTIDVSSAEGKGTTVTVTLPGIETRHRPCAGCRGWTDGVDHASWWSRTTPTSGAPSRSSWSGPATRSSGRRTAPTALDEFQHRRHHLVVLDINLPILDGWAVLERIRSVSAAPILLLTAHGLESDKVRGLLSGADDYLTKPYSNDELVARSACFCAVPRRPTRSPPSTTTGGSGSTSSTRPARWPGRRCG